MTTFKFFSPNGDCRRKTFDRLPDLSSVNAFLDGIENAPPVDCRLLSYIDSEGDRIVISTSQDISEAVKDADASGQKTIKVQIRRIAKGGSKTNNPHSWCRTRSWQCHPHWSTSGHPIYGFHVGFRDNVNDLCDLINAFFPACAKDTKGKEKENAPANSPVDSSVDTTKKSAENEKSASHKDDTTAGDKVGKDSAGYKNEASSPRRSDNSTHSENLNTRLEHQQHGQEDSTRSSPAADSSFMFVDRQLDNGSESDDRGKATDDKVAAQPDSKHLDLDGKAKLLREMGFEVPLDVAKEMIAEMGGRMDLIVRALVTNNK